MKQGKSGGHALIFVLITVLIDMIGIGIIIPVLPTLIGSIAHTDTPHAAMLGGWLLVAYSLMQFLFGPVVGNLSDAFGRRPVLLISIGGLGIDYLLTALAPSLAWLFTGRIVAGICGASYATANAYIADITAPQDRAKAFGLVGAAFGVGFIIGPALGGLLGAYGDRVPFYVAAVLSLANLVYGLAVLPETLPPEKRRPFSLARANPFGALAALRHRPALTGLAAVVFLHLLATAIYPAIWSFYTAYRYQWDEWHIGLSLAFFGAVTAVVQAGLVGPVVARLGEARAILISLFVEILAALGYGLAGAGWMIYALILAGAPQSFAMPALTAMMSNRVAEDAQGELQGAIASLMGISSIFGPLLATQAFGVFAGTGAVREIPGMPFFIGTLLSILALALFLYAMRRSASPPAA